jgi:hypothetical protein
MNAGDVRARVQSDVGDTSGALITNEDIYRWINDAQREVTRRIECNMELASTPSSNGRSSYDLPNNCFKPMSLSYNDVPLDRTTKQLADQYWPTRVQAGQEGTPLAWYTYSNSQKIWLYPAPAADGDTIKLWFLRSPIDVVDDDSPLDLPEDTHGDVVTFVKARAKEKDEEDQKAAALMAQFDVGMAQAKSDEDDFGDSYPAIRALPGDDGSWGDSGYGAW